MHYNLESVGELKTVINATKNPNDSVSDKAIHIKFYDNEKYVGEVYLSSIDTDNVFVYNLEVSKSLRGQGYGRAIMNHILANYPIGELMVDIDNKVALNLYKSIGFVTKKKIRGNDGKDQYWMRYKKKVSESDDDKPLERTQKPCEKCGGKVSVYMQGEPIFKCTKCGKVYGVVPFNESVNQNDVPVYIMLMHTGTALANAIKTATGAKFSHSSISFDTSMRNMYSFGRKFANNPFIGGFKKEDIQSPFFKAHDVVYALYVVFCTKREVELMKRRLDYFIQRNDEFKYDFTGLIKNYFGIEDNPEHKWFCSRFVADIINSGKPSSDPFIAQPSLVKPHEFASMPFTIYVTGGNLAHYRPKLVERIVARKLQDSVTTVHESNNEGVNTSMASNIFDQMCYEFFGHTLGNSEYLMEAEAKKVNTNNIPDEIEPIVKKLEAKGYDVKYASPGYIDGHFKNDANKDGVVNGKMVSTGRVIFARNYRFQTTPDGWGWKALHNGFKALYVKPRSNDYDDNTDYNVIEWHNKCIKSLREWADNLPKMGSPESKALIEDKHLATV